MCGVCVAGGGSVTRYRTNRSLAAILVTSQHARRCSLLYALSEHLGEQEGRQRGCVRETEKGDCVMKAVF